MFKNIFILFFLLMLTVTAGAQQMKLSAIIDTITASHPVAKNV